VTFAAVAALLRKSTTRASTVYAPSGRFRGGSHSITERPLGWLETFWPRTVPLASRKVSVTRPGLVSTTGTSTVSRKPSAGRG
jgi:hypothetical protein